MNQSVTGQHAGREPAREASSARPGLRAAERFLQRACACGKHTGHGGECAECRRKREALERAGIVSSRPMAGTILATAGPAAAPRTTAASGFGHDFTGVPSRTRVQPRLRVGAPGDVFEREAERVADAVTRSGVNGSGAEVRTPVPASRPGASPAGVAMCTAAAPDLQGASAVPAPRPAPGPSLPGLVTGGRPLDSASRAFFESRMGHDFGNVRIHTGDRADGLAASIGARAFTWGNHIVFASGELAPGTAAGRHLLAHELAHTIQQGAVGPRIQRSCADLASPPPMTCEVATTSPGSTATNVEFAVNSADLTPGAIAILDAIVAEWHRAGGSDVLRLDGFASVEGAEAANCTLSCDRANAVAAELMAPSSGDPGIPATHLRILAQGETISFSPVSLAANRKVSITSSTGAPAPGPACGITVTGPDEVDHYCAAYVPTDAASCGTFPAPTIVLTAAGLAAGATARWSIVGNPGNARIVGSGAGASVVIEGVAPSTAQGDTVVQVTDGTCSALHHLTVREPSQMTATQAPTVSPSFVQNMITYTVRDQFGNPMGAGICVDETITVCANNIGTTFTFGDAATNASGQVSDNLSIRAGSGSLPAGMCVKLDQTLTAGGCGPLLHNTITMRTTGITLTHGAACAPGGACP